MHILICRIDPYRKYTPNYCVKITAVERASPMPARAGIGPINVQLLTSFAFIVRKYRESLKSSNNVVRNS